MIISSHHFTLSRQRRIFLSSLKQMMKQEIDARRWLFLLRVKGTLLGMLSLRTGLRLASYNVFAVVAHILGLSGVAVVITVG